MSNLVERYQFLSTVAQNQNSRMHRCFDKTIERDVAVKIWNTPSDSINKSLGFQYSILARINNHFIVKATDSGRTGEGLPFLATEWVAGGSLNESSNSFTIEEIVAVMSQLAEGLDFLHSIGFVHGDIKPGNILTDKNEMGGLSIRLTDFEFLEPGGNFSPQCWKGTPAYMAPEIIRGELVTFHSDLYSFGVLLYHLLTGRLPFQEQELYELAYAHLDKEPSFEAPEVSNLSPQLVTLVLNLLQKNPAERPDAAWKVRDSLIRDVDSIKRADRLLAHSLIDYCLGERPDSHLPEENLHRTLNEYFNGLDPERKLCQFLLNKSGGEPKSYRKFCTD